MVGRALVKRLTASGHDNILTRSSVKLDLTRQGDVRQFFNEFSPEYVFLAAAKVGGIHANNTYPADFIYNNLMIQSNVIEAAHANHVKRLLFLGSSCIYPVEAAQPMAEDALLTGTLEPTNEPYAIAKIAGIKMCESFNRQHSTSFRSVMPTNLYGEHDNFHPENSHVVPGLIRRFHQAKIQNKESVVIWGTGKPKREFLHVHDMASACIHIMQMPEDEYAALTKPRLSHINIGSGEEITIADLAQMIKKITGYHGRIVFDKSKPDGSPRKLLDSTRLSEANWQPEISLYQGLEKTCQWFVQNLNPGKN